mmetsp:Transcript_31645/g.63206  ORF Transcript_31645/g.63206 Transcript_31645/m.63206 type:complete len:259 (+) Transcript_31645:728-1504(+)
MKSNNCLFTYGSSIVHSSLRCCPPPHTAPSQHWSQSDLPAPPIAPSQARPSQGDEAGVFVLGTMRKLWRLLLQPNLQPCSTPAVRRLHPRGPHLREKGNHMSRAMQGRTVRRRKGYFIVSGEALLCRRIYRTPTRLRLSARARSHPYRVAHPLQNPNPRTNTQVNILLRSPVTRHLPSSRKMLTLRALRGSAPRCNGKSQWMRAAGHRWRRTRRCHWKVPPGTTGTRRFQLMGHVSSCCKCLGVARWVRSIESSLMKT